MKEACFFALLLVGCAAEAAPTGSGSADQTGAKAPAWMGNAVTYLERSDCAGESCSGGPGRPAEQGFTFDSWARQQAGFATARFEVWEPGVTDGYDANLWRDLDVQVHYRFGATGAFQDEFVVFDKTVGNNARYAFDLRKLDPMSTVRGTITRADQCPKAPFTASGSDAVADLQFYITANGARLPQGSAVYHGSYVASASALALCLKH